MHSAAAAMASLPHLGRPAALPTATGWGEELLDRAVRHWPHGPERSYMSARDRATPDRLLGPERCHIDRTGRATSIRPTRSVPVPHPKDHSTAVLYHSMSANYAMFGNKIRSRCPESVFF